MNASFWRMIDGALAARGVSSDPATNALGLYPPYLGQVATNCLHMAAILVGTSTQMNMWSAHFARDDITSLQVAWANYFGSSEAGPLGNLTVTASVEYPIGTLHQVTWSASTSCVIASGDMGPLSDPVAVVIPKGALFRVRAFETCAQGVPLITSSVSASNLQVVEVATSGLTDKTMSGTVSGTGMGTYATPALIVAQTTRPSFAIFGDSIGIGGDESGTLDYSGDVGIVARSVGQSYAYLNISRAGDTLANLLTSAGAKRRALAAYCSGIICEMGRNDFTAGRTAAQHAANIQSLAALFPGKPVFSTTVTPLSTSSDTWVTVGNQTAGTGNAERVAFNERLRANSVPGAADFLDVTSVVESSLNSGLWAVGMVTTTGGGAGLHPNTAGYLAVRQARAITAEKLRFGRI